MNTKLDDLVRLARAADQIEKVYHRIPDRYDSKTFWGKYADDVRELDWRIYERSVWGRG